MGRRNRNIIKDIISVYVDASYHGPDLRAIGAYYIDFLNEGEAYIISYLKDNMMAELLSFEIMLHKLKKKFENLKIYDFHIHTDCKVIYDVINDVKTLPIYLKSNKMRESMLRIKKILKTLPHSKIFFVTHSENKAHKLTQQKESEIYPNIFKSEKKEVNIFEHAGFNVDEFIKKTNEKTPAEQVEEINKMQIQFENETEYVNLFSNITDEIINLAFLLRNFENHFSNEKQILSDIYSKTKELNQKILTKLKTSWDKEDM